MAEQKKYSWKDKPQFPPGFRPEPGTFVPPKNGPKPPPVPPHFVKHAPRENYCCAEDHFMADREIQNIPQLIAYIKGQLGSPIICVELSDSQILDVIRDMVQYIWRYYYKEGNYRDYLCMELFPGKTHYKLCQELESVVDFQTANWLGNINELFTVPHNVLYDQIQSMNTFNYNGMCYGDSSFGDVMGNFNAQLIWLEQVKFDLGESYQVRYNAKEKELSVWPSPRRKVHGLMEVMKRQKSYRVFNDYWFKELVVCRCGMLWTSALAKYSLTLAGGGTLNAESRYSAYKERFDSAIERIDRESPHGFIYVRIIHKIIKGQSVMSPRLSEVCGELRSNFYIIINTLNTTKNNLRRHYMKKKKFSIHPQVVKNDEDFNKIKTEYKQIQKIFFKCDWCQKPTVRQIRRIKESPCMCKDCSYKWILFTERGVINMFQLKSVKDKCKETMIKKFGVENHSQCKEHWDSVTKTSMKKFGTKRPAQSQKVKDKQEKTNIKKYGSKSALTNKEVIKKTRKTMNEKWGCDYAAQNKEIRSKQKHKYTYDGKNFDSSWEIAYYIYLTDHHIRFEYHPIDFDYYYPGDNKIHKYEVDFKLFDNTYVEIKNIYLLNKMTLNKNDKQYYRYLSMIENNVKVITDCKKYIKYVENKYGKYYLKSFKTINTKRGKNALV